MNATADPRKNPCRTIPADSAEPAEHTGECPFLYDPDAPPGEELERHPEDAASGLNEKLNRLRAGVLGANDGIVSTAAVVVGVAAAGASTTGIATAGAAAVLGGAISMALGEYVSVSSQRDTERALVDEEREDLRTRPAEEFRELVDIYRGRGLSAATARAVATELTARDPLAAHLDVHWGIEENELVSPWAAGVASFVSFLLGALVPMAAILLGPESGRIVLTGVVTLAALAATGGLAAKLGGADPAKAAVRVTVGGALALVATYGVGLLFE
ncbi:VIT1/CCC1 transporter family protein [Corynebacterium frankenforstense]